MNVKRSLPLALLVLGVVLVVAPALFPIQPLLYHDTGRETTDNASVIQERGYEIVAYENLSERGQELYVRSLENGGEYTVPVGEGAPEFPYPTPGELGNASGYAERNAMQGVAIERPPDADLPPADEPVDAAEHLRDRWERRNGENRTTEDRPSVEEYRRQIQRYDLVHTRTDAPGLTAPAGLLRLCSVVLGIVAIGTGGYLRSRP